ncbi:hypothetical protein ESA94_14065 [Lacibacter luteus]|uniref:DUF6311 domain-containing protein n=1 Tax=Lacibacter luteus TaxID=2508719 RepID=A0A4Q1CGL7_9BACT|nr:hypothetical protein [Lacibacter luteus]RXK59262.1 hypothetical protein ESA94_14065 [Lacibacter luteus]
MQTASRYSLLLLLCASAAITLLVFWPVVTHLNSAMFTYSGDGLKNYYAVSWYLQHNHGLHFTGMNYPFGEHLSFADGQPGLSLPYKWISYLFPSLQQYGIGLTNAAVLIGIFITPYFLYKILRHYHVSNAFAITGALLICFLSPQLFRIEAHYGLSYPFFFCAAWYFFLLFEEKKTIRSAVVLIAFISWIGLLHFYLAVIVALFLTAYLLPASILQFKTTDRKQLLLRWAIVITPIVLLQLFMLTTDSITDRPTKPWGFFYATSDWTSVFLPHIVDLFGNPAKPLFDRYWEGFAYIGMTANLFCIIFIIHSIVRLVQTKQPRSIFTTEQNLFLLSAVLLLLFSMSIPFKWGLQSLIDKLPMLRQFRAPGRFAWPFYYVTGVFCIVYICRLIQDAKKAFVKNLLLSFSVLLALVWTAECIYRMIDRNELAKRAVAHYRIIAEQNIADLLNKSGHYASEFQSLLVLPYFHVGSEKFSMNNGLSEIHAMKTSLQTGLPLMNVMLSRTSLEQSKQSVQFISDSLVQKQLINKLSGKPILVLVTPQELTGSEQELVRKSKLLASQNGWSLYALQPASLSANHIWVKMQFTNRQQLFKQYGSYFSNDSASSAILKFTDVDASINKPANGVQFANELSELLKFPVGKYKAGDTLRMSAWLSIEADVETFPVLACTQQDAEGKDIRYDEASFKRATNVYGNNVMAVNNFVMHPNAVQVSILLYNPARIFNLQVCRINEIILMPSGKSFYFNNIFIP